MKKIFALLSVLGLVFGLAGCGDDEAAPVVPVIAEEAQGIAEEAQGSYSLLGTWVWMGNPYYVFEDGGIGTMAGMPINWEVRNGILTVCSTPDTCNDIASCFAPSQWYYTLSGNELTLDSTLLDMTFTYTRR